ncbi:hypothetical protein [Chlamydiifrater phoenicopteri]|uniref:hypothetical protein n=1 Tax=Chlamydiifrater phoenicopteri TaxID=2681469 RepID=UPI001BCF56E0|nr:hypothetical protein [Chlamydiifrater phoenicopteri]
MSISRPSGTEHLEQQPSASLLDKIQANILLIQEITKAPPFFPPTEKFDTELEILRSQIFSIQSYGYNLKLIAEAMAISGIYMRTMIAEHCAMTRAQYYTVLSCCLDLSESSGSSSSQQKAAIEATKGKEASLPIKKRALRLVEEAESEDPEAKRIREEGLLTQSLMFLFTTIKKNRGIKAPYLVDCPKGRSEPSKPHLCDMCSLAKNVIFHGRQKMITQLEMLLGELTEQTLLEAMLDLLREQKLPNLQEAPHLSHLEAAFLIVKCKAEEIFLPPERPCSSKLLNFYQMMKSVVSMGTTHPLTKLVMQLWSSSTKLTHLAETVLAINSKGDVCILSTSLFQPTISQLLHRRFFAGGTVVTKPFSLNYSAFLAKLIMSTLQALLASSESEAFVATTNFGKKALLWTTVNHVLGIIFTSNGEWRLELPSSKLCPGPSEEIRFPKESLDLLFKHQQLFVEVNQITHPQTIPLYPPIHELPEECCLLESPLSPPASPQPQEPSAAPQEPTPTAGESQESVEETSAAPPTVSLKHKQKRRHIEQQSQEGPEEPSVVETESTSTPSQGNLHRQMVMFLLEMVLANKERKFSPEIRCPNSTRASSFHHICSQCFLAKRVFLQKRLKIVSQLETLLEHTDKNTLANVMFKLPFGRSGMALFEKEKLSPLDTTYIIFGCKIGEGMRAPGKKNPELLAGLFYSMEKIILDGPNHPTTVLIKNLWLQATESLTFARMKKNLKVLTIKGGAIKPLTITEISACFNDIELQHFQLYREKLVRKNKKPMSQAQINFLGYLALFTLYSLMNFDGAKEHITETPSGAAISWAIVQHVCSLILSINPRWKVSVTPNKASLGDLQDIGFPDQDAQPLYQALLNFAEKNSISTSSTN